MSKISYKQVSTSYFFTKIITKLIRIQKNASISMTLFSLQNFVAEAQDNNYDYIRVFSLDLSKAFDKLRIIRSSSTLSKICNLHQILLSFQSSYPFYATVDNLSDKSQESDILPIKFDST